MGDEAEAKISCSGIQERLDSKVRLNVSVIRRQVLHARVFLEFFPPASAVRAQANRMILTWMEREREM